LSEWRITCWSVVGILGRIGVREKTLSYIFSSREKNFQSASNVGAVSQKRTSNGDGMESFSLNSAKSFIGRNVNLHLKDGAVIVNVQLTKIRKGLVRKGMLVEYVPYGNRKAVRIPLRSIAWAEILNLEFFQTAG
jgi:hypothetical protein